MSEAAATVSRRTDWLLALLATLFVGFVGWTAKGMGSLADSIRTTALQVAVNRENLDQLHLQVNRREDRDDSFTRDALHTLDQRISKLEDRARTGR